MALRLEGLVVRSCSHAVVKADNIKKPESDFWISLIFLIFIVWNY